MKITLHAVLASLFALVATLGGCGGGVGTGGTGSFALGSISGFGSVIVNDVRYDDGSARVEDADGNARSRDDLRLGMTVEVESSAVVSSLGGASATASRIRYSSEIVGVLAAVDVAGGRLTLLGQTVVVDPTTVFDETLGGLATLSAGRRVEIYAAWDPANSRYRATRVGASGGSGNYVLRGVVSALNTTARTLNIGTGAFSYSGTLPAGVANGAFVRVQVQPAAAASTSWTVLSFAAATTQAPEGHDGDVKGLVSAFSSTSSFSVNGVQVNAAGASFPDGTAGLVLGARVEVEGRFSAGVLQASKVQIETEQEHQQGEFRLEGSITAVNPTASTFVLRGQTVSYVGSGVIVPPATLADIRVGNKVKVRGVLSPDGTRVDATRVELDD